MSEPIRVRFAPSPTGYLHIGGARTAIFNWLFARNQGGKFLLRLEDTDVKRSKPEFEEDILKAMEWLGLDWDEEPMRQSQRRTFHREMADELMERGWAYRCFLTPDEVQSIRAGNEARGDTTAFRSPHREMDEAEVQRRIEKGETWVVRFKVPAEPVEYIDGVHGRVTVPPEGIEDFVLLRTDGTPTYQTAVVGDDYEMGVNYIIRGDDHISNTPKQILIYRGLKWPEPTFAHVPLILGPDKKRLSKRHGAAAVTEYRERGYLPDAIFSFLAMLGWSPKDDSEMLSREELAARFNIEGINKRSAVFDEQKLEHFNAHFISQMSDDELELLVRPILAEKVMNSELPKGAGAELPTAVRLLKTRARFPRDIVERGEYFFKEPETVDPKAAKKRLKDDNTPEFLEKLADRFEALDEFTEERVEETLRGLSEELEIGTGKLIHPTRLAVSGQGSGPGLFELLAALGKEKVVRRMHWLADFLREKGTPPELGE